MAENCTTFSKENQETYVFLFSVQTVRYIIEYVPVINLKQYAKKRMEISFAKVLSDYTLSSSLRMQKKKICLALITIYHGETNFQSMSTS